MGRRQSWQCTALLPVVGCLLLKVCSGGDEKRSQVSTGNPYPSWMLWVHTAILYPLCVNFWLKLGALMRYKRGSGNQEMWKCNIASWLPTSLFLERLMGKSLLLPLFMFLLPSCGTLCFLWLLVV